MGTVRIKDHWGEQRIFEQRAFAAAIVIVVLTLVLIGRLVVLQVTDAPAYQRAGLQERLASVDLPAPRGSILDRNDKP